MRQASGSRQRVPSRHAGQCARDVLAGEQPGHPDVATEEVVGHGPQLHVVARVRCQQGLQDPGAVGARQHDDRAVVGSRRRSREAWGAVALRRRGVDGREEPVAHASGPTGRGLREGLGEGPRHANPVLVLGIALVVVR